MWAWKGPDGQAEAVFSDAFVRRCPDVVKAVSHGRLPPVVPDLELILVGGLSDGIHLYSDAGQPELWLEVASSMPLLWMPGEEPAETTVIADPVTRYALQRQACGHGRRCPFVYAVVS